VGQFDDDPCLVRPFERCAALQRHHDPGRDTRRLDHDGVRFGASLYFWCGHLALIARKSLHARADVAERRRPRRASHRAFCNFAGHEDDELKQYETLATLSDYTRPL
jgi:hypothetical protein